MGAAPPGRGGGRRRGGRADDRPGDGALRRSAKRSWRRRSGRPRPPTWSGSWKKFERNSTPAAGEKPRTGLHDLALGRLLPAQKAFPADPRLNELADEAEPFATTNRPAFDRRRAAAAVPPMPERRGLFRDALQRSGPRRPAGGERGNRLNAPCSRFGLTPGSGNGPALNGAYFTEAEKSEIRGRLLRDAAGTRRRRAGDGQ